jgi:IS1 family transposase
MSMGQATDGGKRPMHVLPLAKRAEVVEHLMEGNGIRPTSRLCGVDKNTVLSLLLTVARGAEALHNHLVRDLDVVHVEADELHSFVKKRVKNIMPADPPEIGEQWVWIAFARATKLIVSWRVGKRDEANALLFMRDMRARLSTVPILSTDGLQAYLSAVGETFFSPEQPPGAVHFGQVVKSFTNNRRDYDKVAPAPGPPRTTKRIICGTPEIGEISTSITEREMLALRTNLRRLVRRGSGHSKSLEHHTAAVAAFATWANFCRPSSALKSKTPAMVSGLADHRWTTIEFVEACLLAEPCEPPAPGPLAHRAAPEVPARVTSTGRVIQLVRPAEKGAPAVPSESPEKRQAAPEAGKQLDLFADAIRRPRNVTKPLLPKGTQLTMFDEL